MTTTEEMLAQIYRQQYGPAPVRPPVPSAPDRQTYNQGAGVSQLDLSPSTLAYLRSQNPDLFPQAQAPVYRPQPERVTGPKNLSALGKKKPTKLKTQGKRNPKDRDTRG